MQQGGEVQPARQQDTSGGNLPHAGTLGEGGGGEGGKGALAVMVCDWPCVETWRESCCRKPWTSLVRFLMDTLFASQTAINPVSKEWTGSAWVGGGDGGCGGSGVELQRSVGTGAGLTGNLRDERPMASSGTDGSTKEKFSRSESPIREQRQQELGHHRGHDHSVHWHSADREASPRTTGPAPGTI